MISRIAVIILATLLGLGCADAAFAGRFFVQAHGGASLFNMDDVNDAIDMLNDTVAEGSLDNINGGSDLGIHAGYYLTPELGLGLGYARLNAESGFSNDPYLVEFDMPADLYEVFIDFLPVKERTVNFGAGGTVGLVSSRAKVQWANPDFGAKTDVYDGMGFLFAGYGIMDVSLNAKFTLFGHAGFRHAVISTLKVDDEIIYNPDSIDDKLRFSYSGFYMRVGVRFRP